MKITATEIEKFSGMLEQTPRRIADIIARVSDDRLHFKANKRSWSANDVLAHIRSCADVWGQSIESMLEHDHPVLAENHPRKWMREKDYLELDFQQSFKAYSSQRKKLLRKLRKLHFEDWSRGATIGEREHTVFSQVRRMAKHETEHCKQIESLLQ